MLAKSNIGQYLVVYKLPINRVFLHHFITEKENHNSLKSDCNRCRVSSVYYKMKILTKNSSRMKYLALVTLGSSPGSGITER